MKGMNAKGEALNDSMLSQQLVWWCLDLAIWHHVRSVLLTNAIEATYCSMTTQVPSRVQGQSGFEAAVNRDYPVMLGTLYFFTLLGLVMNLAGDLAYVAVDPRIDFESRQV